MKYNEEVIESLIRELEDAKAEALRFRGEHQEACHLVAQMHAAAVGEVTGPARGVVEDVEDLRRSRDQWKKEWELSERNRMDREAEIVKLKANLVMWKSLDGIRDYDALMREREQVGNALGERTQERDEARAALKAKLAEA